MDKHRLGIETSESERGTIKKSVHLESDEDGASGWKKRKTQSLLTAALDTINYISLPKAGLNLLGSRRETTSVEAFAFGCSVFMERETFW